MLNVIKIYAPADGEIKNITECSDEMFSQKMLGDGIVFKPSRENFKSPFESANIDLIFDTKHAIYFGVNDQKALMHIGIDTVKLNGEPFDLKVKVNQKVNLDSEIVFVNLKNIKDSNLSTETPIVFEIPQGYSSKVKILKSNAKQGELVAEISIELQEKVSVEKLDDDVLKIDSFKGKYHLVAEEIFANLGGQQNYSNVFNCMTRFRANIKDQTKVNVEELKKIGIVKGVQYSGEQLQIIIGGEVSKVMDEFKKRENHWANKNVETKKERIPFKKRILPTITGVVGPALGLLLAGGMFSAIYTILQQTGAVTPIGGIEQIYKADMISGIFFLLSKIFINSIGIFFMYNLVKMFKGNTLFAIAVGLIFLSRAFFPTGAKDITADIGSANFGEFVSFGAGMKQGWFLFAIGDTPILIGGMEGTVLPYIAAGIVILFADKWIKTWMPSSVDIIFRAMLVILITIFSVWFIFGPLLGLFESGLAWIVLKLGQIPFGIGTAIFAVSWPLLVLTGMHVSVAVPIYLPILMGNWEDAKLFAGMSIGNYAQVGAVIAVAIVTRNHNLKKSAYASIVGGLFGVTEPIIYGINLPRFRPFVFGLAGAFVGGLVAGNLNLHPTSMPGGGPFGMVAYGDKWWIMLISWLSAVIAAFGLTLFFFKERKNEYKLSKQAVKKTVTLSIKNSTSDDKKIIESEIEKEFNELLKNVNSLKDDYKKYEKYLQTITKLDYKNKMIEEKENSNKFKMYESLISIKEKLLKLEKGSEKYNKLLEKFTTKKVKYQEYNLNTKKDLISELIKNTNTEIEEFKNHFTDVKKSNLDNFEKTFEMVSAKYNLSEYGEVVKNTFYNGVYSIEIGYGFLDSLNSTLPKQKTTKNK